MLWLSSAGRGRSSKWVWPSWPVYIRTIICVLLPTERSSCTQRRTPRHRRRRNLWHSCSARFHRNVKIFGQPVGRSRLFSDRSLLFAEGRPILQIGPLLSLSVIAGLGARPAPTGRVLGFRCSE